MIKTSLLLSITLLLGTLTHAQKVLQLEKSGSLRTTRFYIGDPIIYTLKKDKRSDWRSEYIEDVFVEEGYVQLQTGLVSIDSIDAIKLSGSNKAKGWSKTLTTFSGIWAFWSGVALAYGEDVTPFMVGVGGGALLLGQTLKWTTRKVHRTNGRKRLRLLDLNFYDHPR